MPCSMRLSSRSRLFSRSNCSTCRAFASAPEALRADGAALEQVVGEEGRALLQNLPDDGAAHLDGAACARVAPHPELGDGLAALADEQDRAALGGHDLEDEAQKLALQLVGRADGVDGRAELDEQREVARQGGE